MLQERRKVPRFSVEWKLRARLSFGQWVRGRTIDISTSGLLFSTTVDLEIGACVDLEISTQRLETIYCRVRIQREISPDANMRCYGAEFLQMSREDCLLLGRRLVALPRYADLEEE